MLAELNSPVIYLICGAIILFVAGVSVVFLVRAYRAGRAIGMDEAVLKEAITSSAVFSVIPSIGILLGVIALSGSLGVPWPWLRLSVIGALHYETQVAMAAAEQVGMTALDPAQMTAEAFSTIALLMSVCIMWGMVLSVFFNRRYSQKRVGAKKSSGLGDKMMDAMFIGLVSAYIGSYIGTFVSGEGRFSFSGSWLSLAVAAVAAGAMAVFLYLIEKKGVRWLESFAIAGSMLIGMIAAVVIGG